jgi:Tol biopolymer transport system component
MTDLTFSAAAFATLLASSQPSTPPVMVPPSTPPVMVPPSTPPVMVPPVTSLGGWLLGGPSGFDPIQDPHIFKRRVDGTQKTFLTTGPGINLNPSWSYDGKWISFACNGRTGLSPCIVKVDGTGKIVLPVDGTTPVFSPDGLHIVYRTVNPQSEVWVANVDGTGAKQLTTTTVASNTTIRGSGAASYSPDGKRIIYTSSQSGTNELWTMDADGGNKKQLTSTALITLSVFSWAAPDANAGRFSPDGLRIVFFAGHESPGTGNVYVMDVGGTNPKMVSSCTQTPTGISANCDGPSWIDDTHIIYQSNRALNSGGVDPQNIVRNWMVQIDTAGNKIDGTDKVVADVALNYGSRPYAP